MKKQNKPTELDATAHTSSQQKKNKKKIKGPNELIYLPNLDQQVAMMSIPVSFYFLFGMPL